MQTDLERGVWADSLWPEVNKAGNETGVADLIDAGALELERLSATAEGLLNDFKRRIQRLIPSSEWYWSC